MVDLLLMLLGFIRDGNLVREILGDIIRYLLL